MLEPQKPLVTELALADALDRLVNQTREFRADVGRRVQITFSGTPDVGFPMQREIRDIPGEIVHRVWNEGLRDYETPHRSGPETPSETTGAGHAWAFTLRASAAERNT